MQVNRLSKKKKKGRDLVLSVRLDGGRSECKLAVDFKKGRDQVNDWRSPASEKSADSP